MYTKVVTVLSNSGTGTQDITFTATPSWTPKAAIVQYSGAAVAAGFNEGVSLGYGFTDGTNQRCIAYVSEDAVAASDTARIQSNNSLITTLNQTGTITTVDSVATFTQWLSNGMQITWSNAPTTPFYITVTFLGGSDLTNVQVGTLMTTTGASCSVTGMSWQPDFGMFLYGNFVTENSGSSTTPSLSIGAAKDASNQWNQTWAHVDASGTSAARTSFSHGRVVVQETTTLTGYSVFSTWNADGFTLNNTDTYAVSHPIYYLVLKGGQTTVGNSTEPAGTGTQTITTNTLVKSVMVLGLDHNTADTIVASGMWSTGAGHDSSNIGSITCDELPASDPMANAAYLSTTYIYNNITANATAASSVIDDQASLDSVSSTGFVLNWNNIGQARPFRYITFGGATATLNPVTISDTPVISVSETLARVQTIIKPISEPSVSIGAGAVTGAKLYSRSISESSVSVSAETIEAEREVERSISDTPTVTVGAGAVTGAATYPRPITNEDSISTSDTIEKEADYTRSIDESPSVSISDGDVVGTKIPAGPTAKLWDVHFVEFPEDISDEVEGLTGKTTSLHTHKFNIEIGVSTTKTHKYDVISQISTTKTHKFNVSIEVSTTKDHLWNIISRTSTTKTHKYSIITTTSTTKTHKYNVEASVSRVSTTKTHKYNVISKTSTTKTHVYNLIRAVTGATRTHKWNIISTVSVTKTHRYNVSIPVSQVSTTKTHKYDIIKKITAPKTHIYSVIGLLTVTKTHKYNVNIAATTTKTHKYSIITSVSRTVTHRYAVISKTERTRTHKYNVLHKLTSPKTHKYNVLATVTKSKTHRYNVSNAVSTTKTHIYSILAAATKTKTHKYNIIGKVTRTHTHKWNAGGRVTTTKRHLFNVGFAFEQPVGAGSATVQHIKFPPRVSILDIISDIRNIAIADIQIVPDQRIICVGVVELEEYPFVSRTANVYKPKHRIASTLVIPQIVDTIENRAISDRIAIEILPIPETPQIQVQSGVVLGTPDQLYLKSQTQIKQDPKAVLRLSSNTELDVKTRIASMANLELAFLNNIRLKTDEMMTKEKEQVLRLLIDVLKSDDVFI